MSAQHTEWSASVFDTALQSGTDVYALARLLTSHGARVQHAHEGSLHLAVTDVAELTRFISGIEGAPEARLVSTHLGLTGATSPLPQESLTALEEAMAADGGEQLTAWLAQLHHRLLELLHEGVNRAQLGTCASTTLNDAVSEQLLQASAHATKLLPRALRLSARAVLSKPCCSAIDVAWAMRRVLQHNGLDSDVQCAPMTGGTMPLGAQEAWMLGHKHNTLGASCVLGQFAPTPAGRIDVELGPVHKGWVSACAPEQLRVAAQLRGMLWAALPPQIEADVTVLLEGDALEPLQLRAAAQSTPGPNPFVGLGANVFLGAPPARQAVPWSHACAGLIREGAHDVAFD